MESEHLPRTITELAQWMKERCYNFDSYSIGGNSIYEGFGLEATLDGYVWYYTERGQRASVAFFATEQEAVAHAHQQVVADKWATAHHVGLTANQREMQALADQLRALGITFWQDVVAGFYGPEQSAYRTFVAGCDINRVSFLKQRYYHEP
jgi:extradiol dioxygenase family protein